jgi:hypothetical protein
MNIQLNILATVMFAALMTTASHARVSGTHRDGVCTSTDSSGVTANLKCGSGIGQAECSADGNCAVGPRLTANPEPIAAATARCPGGPGCPPPIETPDRPAPSPAVGKLVIVRSKSSGVAFKGTTNGQGVTVIRPGTSGRYVVLVEGQTLQTITVPARQGVRVMVLEGPNYAGHITLLR